MQEEAHQVWQESHGKKEKERVRIERQITTLSRRLTNITKAIVDSGGSRRLLNELQVLERREAGLLSQLARLNETPEPILDLDHKEVSARIIQALDINREGTERQQIKDLLRNLIQRLDVVRER